jgi:MATE family multidrug resistance protein
MLLAAVTFVVWPRPLIELYTSDARVLAVGPALLGIVAAFEVFDGIQTVSTGALRGLGETRAPMLANLVGYWVLGLPLGFFLCFEMRWGIYGLWIGLTVALIAIALAVLVRWQRDSKRQLGAGSL